MVFKRIRTRIAVCLGIWAIILFVAHIFLHTWVEGFFTWQDIFIETTAAIIPLSLFANYLYWHIAKPMEGLSAAMKNVVHGIQPEPINTVRNDEIGLLITEFNTVGQALHQRDILLRGMNEQLEAGNRELIAINERLEEADRLKTQFLAGVTHELKTPLSTIRGYSEMMLNGVGGELNPGHRDFTFEIVSSSIHLVEMINDILDYSKAQAGTLDIRFERFDVSDLIDDAERAVHPLLARKKHSFGKSLSQGLEAVTADRLRIKQVMMNLLSNAAKFTLEGGRISVSTFREEGHWGISVTDTGIGIKEEDFSRMFLPFSQLDQSYKREYEGTGLGLAICKKIIDMHGGKIWADSKPGKGSSFYFSIPDSLKVYEEESGKEV